MSTRRYYEVDPVARKKVERLEELLEDYIPIDTAAKLLRVSPVTARTHAERGTLVAVRTPTSTLVPRSEIVRLRQSHAALSVSVSVKEEE
jgi:hypothetical protein